MGSGFARLGSLAGASAQLTVTSSTTMSLRVAFIAVRSDHIDAMWQAPSSVPQASLKHASQGASGVQPLARHAFVAHASLPSGSLQAPRAVSPLPHMQANRATNFWHDVSGAHVISLPVPCPWKPQSSAGDTAAPVKKSPQRLQSPVFAPLLPAEPPCPPVVSLSSLLHATVAMGTGDIATKIKKRLRFMVILSAQAVALGESTVGRRTADRWAMRTNAPAYPTNPIRGGYQSFRLGCQGG
jgi:hypothetical protein